ncbi:MAG: hypothetical protein PPP58_11735, partial [Natronomonas sp.]
MTFDEATLVADAADHADVEQFRETTVVQGEQTLYRVEFDAAADVTTATFEFNVESVDATEVDDAQTTYDALTNADDGIDTTIQSGGGDTDSFEIIAEEDDEDEDDEDDEDEDDEDDEDENGEDDENGGEEDDGDESMEYLRYSDADGGERSVFYVGQSAVVVGAAIEDHEVGETIQLRSIESFDGDAVGASQFVSEQSVEAFGDDLAAETFADGEAPTRFVRFETTGLADGGYYIAVDDVTRDETIEVVTQRLDVEVDDSPTAEVDGDDAVVEVDSGRSRYNLNATIEGLDTETQLGLFYEAGVGFETHDAAVEHADSVFPRFDSPPLAG